MQPLKQTTTEFTLTSKVHPWRGVTVVIALHALLFFAFYTGLGEKIIQSKPLVVMAQLVSVPPPQQQPEPVFKEPETQIAKPQPSKQLPSEPVVQRTEALAQSISVPISEPSLAVPEPTRIATPQPVTEAKPTPMVAVARLPATLQASGTCQKPEYPSISKRKEEEGTVLLKFLIGVQGQVLDSTIERSSGFVRLDEAARDALAQCQFKPGSVDGKPEPSWAHVKYTWRLD